MKSESRNALHKIIKLIVVNQNYCMRISNI
uniref:Uncharacterized protein n=1 Tax=Wuchereria bancrofti TaxID=6293 RepID=A0AAF5PGV8_WUCBA